MLNQFYIIHQRRGFNIHSSLQKSVFNEILLSQYEILLTEYEIFCFAESEIKFAPMCRSTFHSEAFHIRFSVYFTCPLGQISLKKAQRFALSFFLAGEARFEKGKPFSFATQISYFMSVLLCLRQPSHMDDVSSNLFK